MHKNKKKVNLHSQVKFGIQHTNLLETRSCSMEKHGNHLHQISPYKFKECGT